jgi:hypothetical protein
MEASPTPVMLFDAGARLVRANRATREAIPDLEVGATAAVQEVATAVHDALAGRPPRPFDVTVYQPERRRFHAHLRTYPDRGTRCCVVVLADESAEADYRMRGGCSRPACRTSCAPRWHGCWRWSTRCRCRWTSPSVSRRWIRCATRSTRCGS